MRSPSLSSLAVLASLSLASTALADRIRQTDGTVLEDVTIVEESLGQVVYKKGNNQRTVPSEQVLSVSYERLPRLLDEAEALLSQDDLLSALEQFEVYADGQIANPSEARKWPAPLAAYRALQLRMEIADLDGIVSAANRLIQGFGESRYVPAAYLAKASAQLQSGQAPQAQKTLADFEELIRSKQLSKRWDLECRLAKIQADTTTSGDAKRKELAGIQAEAAEFPTVKNRAFVVEGETYLADARQQPGDSPQAQELRDKAQKVFQQIIADQKAEDETLAGAYCGLGDCLYATGASKMDKEILQQAAEAYLRVIVLYEGQNKYVPYALYHAGRCFHLLEDGRRKFDMLRTLQRLYPSSAWAAEAKKTF